jgi:hypothetical protein
LCCVHDTVEFEKRGIPASVIITENFRTAAVWQFRGKGMDGHPYIELPHPISNLKPDDMREMTRRFVAQVVRQLTA